MPHLTVDCSAFASDSSPGHPAVPSTPRFLVLVAKHLNRDGSPASSSLRPVAGAVAPRAAKAGASRRSVPKGDLRHEHGEMTAVEVGTASPLPDLCVAVGPRGTTVPVALAPVSCSYCICPAEPASRDHEPGEDGECRQPEMCDLPPDDPQAPVTEGRPEADGRHGDRPPGGEAPGIAEGRQQRDPESAVGEGVEHAKGVKGSGLYVFLCPMMPAARREHIGAACGGCRSACTFAATPASALTHLAPGLSRRPLDGGQ